MTRGAATSAELDNPDGVAEDAHGNLVIADTDNCRIRVVAQSTGTYYGLAMTAGDIYTVAGTGTCGDTGGRDGGHLGQIDVPNGVAVDGHGNLVIADTGNCRIKVVAESTGTFYGKSMTTGDIYDVVGKATCGDTGAGGVGTSAKIDDPEAVATDAHGNIVLTDTASNRIKVLAGATGTFYGRVHDGGRHLRHRRHGHGRLLRRHRRRHLGRAGRSLRGSR